jgi:hypothetical protein
MRIFLILIFLFVSLFIQAQDYYDNGVKADSTLAVLQLNDGTVVNGMILSKSPKEWVVNDYSLGKVIIPSLSIKSWTPVESGTPITITLSNKSILTGKLKETTSRSVIIKTENLGEQEIMMDKIINISTKNTPVQPTQASDSNKVRESTGTRYFFSKNAIPMKKKKNLYKNTMVYLNRVDYAFSDNLSCGIGAAGYIPWLGLKASARLSDKLYMGLDFCVVPFFLIQDFNGGYLHGMITYGDLNNNLTLGAAEFYFAGEFSQAPLITLSGCIQFGPNFWLVSDNLIIPIRTSYYGAPSLYSYEELFVSLGFRFSIKKNSAWEGYFICVPTESIGSLGILPIPVISYSRTW